MQVSFVGSEFAVRVKAARGRGGSVAGVVVEDCSLDGVTEAALVSNIPITFAVWKLCSQLLDYNRL